MTKLEVHPFLFMAVMAGFLIFGIWLGKQIPKTAERYVLREYEGGIVTRIYMINADTVGNFRTSIGDYGISLDYSK